MYYGVWIAQCRQPTEQAKKVKGRKLFKERMIV